MDTDEKGLKRRWFRDSLMEQIIVLALLVVFVFWMTYNSVSGVRTNVKEIIQSSGNLELESMAEKSDFKAGPALESCVRYIDQLENEKSELSGEKDVLSVNIRMLEMELEDLQKEYSLFSSKSAAEYQLCSLFTGGGDKNGGAVFKDGLDDTIFYINYAPKLESKNKWEQYDRIEVDLYKRTGYWANDLNRSISAVLPIDLDEQVYRVHIYLRTDASRLSNREQPDQPDTPSNGGSVTFSVGDQAIAAKSMRLGSDQGEGEGMVVVRGGEQLILTINPQNNTNFFSFAICLEKDIPSTEEGGAYE